MMKVENAGTTQAARLFTELGPRVYHLARRLLGNDADAEDVTQEVFVQVLRKLPTFRGEAALSTWLYRVAVNAALAYRRKRAARTCHESTGVVEAFGADGRHRAPIRRWVHPPDEPVLDGETHRLIENAIAGLPEDSRVVLVLADLEDLSCPEISRLLGLSVAAVKSRLHRARLLLRQALAPHFEGDAA
jgi:RNA polymerase sigma-70 factor (ECF subfamily)